MRGATPLEYMVLLFVTAIAPKVRPWYAPGDILDKSTIKWKPDVPCMQMMFWRPVTVRAIFRAASTASEPEFQKKKESRDASGMIGNSFLMSLR
jgi:hypothetical protein